MKKDESVSAQELLLANAAELDALVEVLVRKGIVTRQELLDEIQAMKQRMHASDQTGSA